MILNNLADGLVRGVESAQSTVSEALFEPVIRLGVTGLARAGKTVFITSLVANMLERNRMGHVAAIREGRVTAAYLQPQPDDTVARFEYEKHMAALQATPPRWPESTRAVSELRLSLRVQPNGLLGGLSGPRVVHIDIVDYPGEWLLDLGLLDQDYAAWSAQVLTRMAERDESAQVADRLAKARADAAFDEETAQDLAQHFTQALHAQRAAGYADCTPGRFLLPGDLAGSPVLTFAPLSTTQPNPRGSLGREMARRFEAYKSKVVRPFFRDHFARIDRQIVLVDALSALHKGPRAVEDLRQTMTAVLSAFRHGKNGFLSQVLMGRRVEKLLFAATKADHLHHKQHENLSIIMQALLADARHRAAFSGAQTHALSLAALRATIEETRTHEGRKLNMVRGTQMNGRDAALFAGNLPDDPAAVLAPAAERAQDWLGQDFHTMAFAPPRLSTRPGEGPPHIRLDKAVEFLIGDRL